MAISRPGLFNASYAEQLMQDQINPEDPVEWIKKRFGVELWSKQREILHALQDNKKVAVQSGHGVGKSLTASVIAAWWVATHPSDETMVVTTAPSARQVHVILWEEIRKLHRKGNLAGEVQRSDNWLIGDTVVGFGRKPQDYDRHAFQGLHRKYVLVIIDEACGIEEWLWIAALSITTGAHCKILAIGNPDDPSAYFAKVCKPGSGWHNIKISVLDSPNFTGEVVSQHVKDQITDISYLDDMRREVGEDSPIWTSKVLGEFPEIDEFSVIPLGWIYKAQERWLEWKETTNASTSGLGPVTVGADIARFGGDKTCFAYRYGNVVTNVEVMPKKDTEGTADLLISRLGPHGTASIDVNGVGAGIYDKLRRRGKSALPFNAGTKTNMKDASGQIEFYNHRAAATWKLRELLDPANEPDICLPVDDKLAADLSAPRWRVAAGGKIVIESKEDIRKRIGRSPDRGDAVTLCFWRNPAPINLSPEDYSFDWADVPEYTEDDEVAVEWESDDTDLDNWIQSGELV